MVAATSSGPSIAMGSFGTMTIDETSFIASYFGNTPVDAQRAVSVPVDLPALAVIDPGSSVTVTATASGNSIIGHIATVRGGGSDPSAPSKSIVIDLGTPCTVSGLQRLPAGADSVQKWGGQSFLAIDGNPTGFTPTFAELLTTKLSLTFTDAVDPADVAEAGVVLAAGPQSLQLLVGARSIWSSTPADLRPTADGRGVTAEVPVATGLQAAVGPAEATVSLTLRGDQPGHLQITSNVRLLQAYDLPLPGAVDPVVATNEGDFPIALPLAPADASSWLVRQVLTTVDAKPPTIRVRPPVGPAFEPLGQRTLTLVPGRVLLVPLPRGLLDDLATLTGVRISVQSGPDGGEVGAWLRSDVVDGPTHGPGPAIPAGAFVPLPVPPGSGVPPWLTLVLPKKGLNLTPDAGLWLAVTANRGTLTLPVADPAADPLAHAPLDSGPAAGDLATPWYRETPTGTVELLSDAPPLAAPLAAIRLIGEVARDVAVPPAELRVGAAVAPVATAKDAVVLRFGPPGIRPAGAPASLAATLRVSAPATYTLTAVRVLYSTTGTGS